MAKKKKEHPANEQEQSTKAADEQGQAQTQAPAGDVPDEQTAQRNGAKEEIEAKKQALATHLGEARDDVRAAWGDFVGLVEAEKDYLGDQLSCASKGVVTSLEQAAKRVSGKISQLTERTRDRDQPSSDIVE